MRGIALLAILALPRLADANAACFGETGWAPSDGSIVPPHPTLLLFTDRVNITDWKPPAPHATIDGSDVKVTATPIVSGPFHMLAVRVDSDKTGKLALTFDKGIPYVGKLDASFTIAAKPAPKSATAVVTTFHADIRHTTVRELYDGLAIHLDVLATTITLEWRRDADSAWQSFELPIVTRPFIAIAAPGAMVGQLGCTSVIGADLLRSGVDVKVTAHLVDGTTVPVALDRLKL
jgi:hypothetical protein